MAQFFRNIAAIAFVFCLVMSAEAQTSSLSADDTVTYINTTLHKYPTLEFVNSGCPGDEQVLMISSDRRSLIIKQNFGLAMARTCEDIQTVIVPVFSLNREGFGGWSKQGQHTSFFLDCIDRVDCFTRKAPSKVFLLAENNWYFEMTAPDQVSDGLTRSIQHLLDSLLTEATARLDGNDSFAKHAH